MGVRQKSLPGFARQLQLPSTVAKFCEPGRAYSTASASACERVGIPIMSEQYMKGRIDAFIEELISEDTVESAAVASILLAARAALRDGIVTDASRAIWWFLDSKAVQGDGPRG